MLDAFHAITYMCVPVAILIIIFLIIIVISSIFKRKQIFGESFCQIYDTYGWKFVAILFIIVLIFINSVCFFIFSKEDIDALYEKKEYTQTYEAYFYEYEDADPYFFLIDIKHSNGEYIITKMHFPLFTEETEIPFDKEKELNHVTVYHWDDLELYVRRGRIADVDSYYRLSLEDYDYTAYEETAETEPDSIPYYVTTQTDPLNMREYPQQDEKIVGQIPKGADINVDSEYGNWGHTYWNGIGGWVNLDYCTPGNNPNPNIISLDTIVYFTEDGKRFHTSVCPHIQGRDTVATSVYYAYEEHGKTPCQVCLYWLDMADLY